jgi:radical SAM protein with 4Fe4S-binding SPASM domain
VFKFGQFDIDSRRFEPNAAKLVKIGEMIVFSYPECDNCFCKYHCAGDCPDLRVSGLLNCEATRRVGAFVMNKKFEAARRTSLNITERQNAN